MHRESTRVTSDRSPRAALRRDLLKTICLVLAIASIAVVAAHQSIRERWQWWAFCTMGLALQDLYRYRERSKDLQAQEDAVTVARARERRGLRGQG